ncbi:putative holin-like toxin, partial [Paraliobacillus quinghaiensis]
MKGGGAMTFFETLTLMISSSTLTVLVLSFHKK